MEKGSFWGESRKNIYWGYKCEIKSIVGIYRPVVDLIFEPVKPVVSWINKLEVDVGIFMLTWLFLKNELHSWWGSHSCVKVESLHPQYHNTQFPIHSPLPLLGSELDSVLKAGINFYGYNLSSRGHRVRSHWGLWGAGMTIDRDGIIGRCFGFQILLLHVILM